MLAEDDVLPPVVALLELLRAAFVFPATEPAAASVALVLPPPAFALLADDKAPLLLAPAAASFEPASLAVRADELALSEACLPVLSAAVRERVAVALVLSRALPVVSSTLLRGEATGSAGRCRLPA